MNHWLVMSSENQSIEANLTDLLIVFDDLLPGTDEDKGVFLFVYRRPDTYEVRVNASLKSGYCAVSLYDAKKNCLSATSINPCRTIRVLDVERKCLEIVGGVSQNWIVRCLINLTGDVILACHAYDDYQYSLIKGEGRCPS